MTFSIPEDMSAYIDSGVPGTINSFNSQADSIVSDFRWFDTRVATALSDMTAKQGELEQLKQEIETAIAETNEAITALRADKAEAEAAARSAYNAGDGVSVGNRVVNIIEIGSSLWSANPNVGWNTDHGSQSDFVASRVAPYDEEIARISLVQTNLHDLKRKVITSIAKVYSLIVICEGMKDPILSLIDSAAGYAWINFRMLAYKDALIDFRTNYTSTDLAEALRLENINLRIEPASDYLQQTALQNYVPPQLSMGPEGGVDEGESEPGMTTENPPVPATGGESGETLDEVLGDDEGTTASPHQVNASHDDSDAARDEVVRILTAQFEDTELPRDVMAGNLASTYFNGDMQREQYVVYSPTLSAYLDSVIDTSLPIDQQRNFVAEIIYDLSA